MRNLSTKRVIICPKTNLKESIGVCSMSFNLSKLVKAFSFFWLSTQQSMAVDSGREAKCKKVYNDYGLLNDQQRPLLNCISAISFSMSPGASSSAGPDGWSNYVTYGYRAEGAGGEFTSREQKGCALAAREGCVVAEGDMKELIPTEQVMSQFTKEDVERGWGFFNEPLPAAKKSSTNEQEDTSSEAYRL